MSINKDRLAILKKLKIKALNPMQIASEKAINTGENIMLLSPTGTGKTLGFLLPILEKLNPSTSEIQVMIVVPSRELALQIEQVCREIGSGYKVNAVYGGISGAKDKINLSTPPAILIGTPGRLADHLRRENFSTQQITTIVLDEFDKSLEVGFEKEMSEIINLLPFLKQKILTSATQSLVPPKFLRLNSIETLNYLDHKKTSLSIKTVISQDKDKLHTLGILLNYLSGQSGIIFCNFKETIEHVSDYLSSKEIKHSSFYGGLEQKDRERALIKFRNKTNPVLLATDLAARGIDVPELDYIIHLQLPFKENEFIHRNGRTARMHNDGVAYIIKYEKEDLKYFIKETKPWIIPRSNNEISTQWDTLFISGGRKDKISKGDIVGLFMKQGSLKKHELGQIELKQDCAFVAVESSKSGKIISQLNNTRLKKKKVRISKLD